MPERRDRWLLPGGDSFYTLARWLVLFLLLVIHQLTNTASIWPPFALRDPVVPILWGYLVFCTLMTGALLIRRLAPLQHFALFVDIAVIALLDFFHRQTADLFYPLYLLPLLGIALQLTPQTGIIAGIFSAVSYMAVAFISPTGSASEGTLGLLEIGLRAIVLILVPVLASRLAEGRSSVNRESVERAEQATERIAHEANAYRDRMRSLYEVAYTLSMTMNYQRVLDTTLLESRKLVPYTTALVLLSSGNQDELYVAAINGGSTETQGQRFMISSGCIGQALRSGEPCVIKEPSREAELQAIASLRSCRAVCMFPLRAAMRTYGVMVLGSDQKDAFNDEQIGMVTALANYAIIGLLNAQLVHDLREERTKLLSKEEEVRHQLARDLHDGPAQALAAITMNVEFIKRLLERDPSRVLNELDKLSALAKRTTHEVRTMLFELRPLVLETQGLDTTLQQYLERFQSNGTQIILEADKIDANLDNKAEGTLFNIIQESVNNALKHAEAKHIWVRVRQTPTALETTIQDDGKGFDLKKVRASYEQRGSFGLLNIDERAKLIGGMSELHSAPGQGTTVRVIVPLS